MATRTELLQALKDAGYSGPTSYGKSRLEELLAEAQGRSQETGRTAEVAPEAQSLPEPDTAGKVVLDEWCGLKGPHKKYIPPADPVDSGETVRIPGTVVRVQGEVGKKFEFIKHVTTAKGLAHVEVKGPIPNYGSTRCFEPSRILDVKRRKPVMS